ncbi:uncharacterized protein K441DRAFT_686969 [Cenococcum geophilum 1.58]|uniref:uncharacterized protein n=1 Tax=Cenococcum geophilum 1.58 TaxID=794803 RepID=UPI0035900A03|nr:hypothetical protein K441DRAFT_686969 [Cenococcum geophilum 1.58]
MASNMVPDYEVKLLMKPSAVLGHDNKLKDMVLSTFSMPASVTKMNVQFLDTDTKDIYDNHWSPRIRKMEGASEFELTYKRRYPISDEPNDPDGSIEDNIDAVLTTAKNEGFDSTTNYDAQVELGYRKQTLSISHDESYPDSGFSAMDLPLERVSREILINKAPKKFKNWLNENWGTGKLAISRIYGPILAKRSKGNWDGIKLYIEVWPIKNNTGTGIEYIVEASFKTASRTTALEKHNKLAAYLQSKDWLLAQDSLKTSLIMERY